MGDEGSSADKGQQDLLDLDGNEHPYVRQLQAATDAYKFLEVVGIHEIQS